MTPHIHDEFVVQDLAAMQELIAEIYAQQSPLINVLEVPKLFSHTSSAPKVKTVAFDVETYRDPQFTPMSNILPMSSEAQAKYKAVYNEVFQETGDATKAAFAARAAVRTAAGQPARKAIITEEQVTELIDKRLSGLVHLTPDQVREIVVKAVESEIAKRVERLSLHELVVNAVGRHVEATIRAPDMKTLKNQLTDALQQRTEKLIEDLVSQVNFNTKIAPPPTGRKLHL